MAHSPTTTLTAQQVQDYQADGYLVIRDVVAPSDAAALRGVVQEQARSDPFPPELRYPQAAKYTVGGNRIAVPGMASIAEHPAIIDAVEGLLGAPAHLTAFVAYLRSPGDKGGGAHCDYKRWRPVGSSMSWLFAIVPLNDFTPEFGPLLVSPGSHRLPQVVDPGAHILDVTAWDVHQLPAFIDPELRAGDLLLMNGFTWHKAPPGTTSEDRCGVFNKLCAANAPPAAGYYPYNTAAYDALSESGKRLIPQHSDLPVRTTRLLLESTAGATPRYLVMDANDLPANGNGNSNGARWRLPGGEGWEEEGVGWDVGARVGALQTLASRQLGIELPWASWICDVQEDGGMCRIYGYEDEAIEDGALGDRHWLTAEELHAALGAEHHICRAAAGWRRNDVVRGRGKGIHQSRSQFD